MTAMRFTFSQRDKSCILNAHNFSGLWNETNFSFFSSLEITSRMAPGAIFQAFRPIHNEKQEIVYTYDWQNISVDLEDRTLVS